jgi:hypothetical protein
MKEFDESPNKAEPVDLELPDWSGMDSSTGRVTVDAAFELCEQYRGWFPELTEKWQLRRPEPCAVEFVL